MKKRLIALLISMAIIVCAIFIVKLLKSNKNQNINSTTQKSVPLVEVITPASNNINYQHTATGKLLAKNRFEIFSQVDGQLTQSANWFKPGKHYDKNETLLKIDQQEYKMTLLSQKSEFITALTSILPDLKSDFPSIFDTWKEYALALDVEAPLNKIPEAQTSKEKFYLSGKGIYSKYYSIKSSEEKLAKYTIRAPFDGVVISSFVEGGKAVRPGTELGTFISPLDYELEVTLPLSASNDINIGTYASLSSTEITGQWDGKVIRIGGSIDEQSQNIKVYIQTNGNKLKEGMFLTAHIDIAPHPNSSIIPRKMLNNNNEVFIVKNDSLRLIKVNVLAKQNNKAIISNLEQNTQILSTIIKNAYDGMPVRVK